MEELTGLQLEPGPGCSTLRSQIPGADPALVKQAMAHFPGSVGISIRSWSLYVSTI